MLRFGAVLVAFSVAACGDDGRPAADGGTDMRTGDAIAPTVRNTTPAEGESGVNRLEPFIVRFSEPMNTAMGSITANPGGPIPAARWAWDDVGSTLTITPNTPWAPGTVVLTIADFEDPSGNVLEEPLDVMFETVDDVRPVLTATEPMEGATDVSAQLDAIVLTFSEQMNTTSGVIDVLGGAGTVGAAEWNAEGTEVTFPIADLEYERDYDVNLRNFRDALGNPLDGEPVVEDGFLDFETGPDTDAPSVVRSEPMEGQVDVNAATQRQIEIVFDEPMMTDTTMFVLNDGTDDIMVRGSWAGGATLLRLNTDGILEFETSYSVDLSGLTDRAGNELDGTEYLVDGSLDFTVSDDVFDPVVFSTEPSEGDMGIDQKEELNIEVVFSEAMDQTLTTATLTDGTTPTTVDGTWATPTIINFTVPADTMSASTEYMLDLTPFMDLTGNSTDTTHPYLMDGMLNFTTGNPSGENCLDALTPVNAMVTGGVTTWTIGSSQVTSREGGTEACSDYEGTATRPDMVIRYDKATPDVAGGGRLLRIVADANTTFNGYDIAVTPGACDPAATPTRCIADSEIHQLYADVPAGPVHIWISSNSSSTFSDSIVVTVEEVDPPAIEGEGCDNPYTTASSIFSSAGGVDTFHIPAGMGPRSMDISPYTTETLVSCDPTSTSSTSTLDGTGVDAVIRYTMPADSVLRVTAEGLDSSNNPEFNVSAYDTCDPSVATAEYGCIGDVSITAKDGIIDAPAGDIYIWLTNDVTDIYRSSSIGDLYFHEAQIDIETIPVSAGETCSRAFAASSGSNPVTGSSDIAIITPGCFGSTSDVEWYSYTTTQPLFVASTVGAGGVAVYDGTTELGCSDDGSVATASALVPTGTTLCVAVEMGQGITNLNIAETAYTGLGLSPPVNLPIERPINDLGSVESITADYWMSGNADIVVMSYNSTGEMLDALKSGSGTTIYRSDLDGLSSSNVGYVGTFAANGALFSFDNTTSSSASRVYRLWDGSAPFWDPVAWDIPPAAYPTQEVGAANFVGNTLYYVTSDDYPVFYSLDATTPSAPVRLGTNEVITDATGLAVDDTYVYVAGEYKDGFEEGVFRIPFTELGNPMYDPVNIAPGIDHDGTCCPSGTIAMYVDSTTAPGHLYIRNYDGHVEAIIDPGGTPIYVGEVIPVGGSGDNAMWLDQSTGSLYLFETDSESTGNFLRYDP
ncbi:MAG: Ig-like domain-containing protein [Deltaproteobacteria bacterium]|nr:Ig-like domain-containing protein [Deltaproteobacteria bacterium]